MTKRVVFAGGVQVKALAKAYRLDVALDYDEDVYFIGAESIAREAAQKVVAAADILITDVTSNGPTVRDDLVQVGTLRIAVPVVTADFIWPYAAGAHPNNMYASGLPDGPYPAGFGDSYLDWLASEGADEDEAISRYLALDVAADASLDEKLGASLAALRALDAQTGFDLADYIEKNFRSTWLFATRDRPNLPFFKHIASRLFGQMGIAASRITQLADTFFPPGAMPIHPSVLAHYGMAMPPPDYLYPILDEGFFSFEAYCRRYWKYEFNRLLHSGIAKADSNPSEAIPELRLALETSPDSRSGLRALKDAERAVSDSSMLTPLVLTAPTPATLTRADSTLPASPPTDDADSGSVAGATSIRLPPELRSTPASGGIVPRAAFGSSLVRTTQPRPDLPANEAESDAPALPSLRFTSFPLPDDAPDQPAGEPVPLTLFPDSPAHMKPLVQLPSDAAAEPEPQGYIELSFGDPPALTAPGQAPVRTRAYTPLAPADHLIPLLPKVLQSTRGMAGVADTPFIEMPETMPPPPLRPVLPPELHPEPVKTSLMSKIMEQLRK